MDKLALCLVGCGAFAQTFARAIDSLRDEVDLYFASRDLGRAEAYAKAAGAFGSYGQAADDPAVAATLPTTYTGSTP